MESTFGSVTMSTRTGPVDPNACFQSGANLHRILDPQAPQTDGFGQGGEVGVLQFAAVVGQASGFLLQLHHAEAVVVEEDDLDRQLVLGDRQQSPSSMASPPSPDSEITCRPG